MLNLSNFGFFQIVAYLLSGLYFSANLLLFLLVIGFNLSSLTIPDSFLLSAVCLAVLYCLGAMVSNYPVHAIMHYVPWLLHLGRPEPSWNPYIIMNTWKNSWEKLTEKERKESYPRINSFYNEQKNINCLWINAFCKVTDVFPIDKNSENVGDFENFLKETNSNIIRKIASRYTLVGNRGEILNEFRANARLFASIAFFSFSFAVIGIFLCHDTIIEFVITGSFAIFVIFTSFFFLTFYLPNSLFYKKEISLKLIKFLVKIISLPGLIWFLFIFIEETLSFPFLIYERQVFIFIFIIVEFIIGLWAALSMKYFLEIFWRTMCLDLSEIKESKTPCNLYN
ncbi:MAG: hypothetical protein AAGA80_18650 [Cyanobacteria bacterium P01_F01_bin.143]